MNYVRIIPLSFTLFNVRGVWYDSRERFIAAAERKKLVIDIHCHILHGLDDGAKDMDESIQMARLAYEDGIRHIIATPHFNHTYYNHSGIVRKKTEQLQVELDRLGIGVSIHPGNEVRMESYEYVMEHAQKESFCYLADNPAFVLVEQPWIGYVEGSVGIVRWFVERGTTPIIPHPERHLFFREQPELLEDLIAAGAWTQVSVDSLLGKNGDEARFFAYGLIDRGFAYTLATDAHNTTRKPNLAEGFRIVERHAGRTAVQTIAKRMDALIPVDKKAPRAI